MDLRKVLKKSWLNNLLQYKVVFGNSRNFFKIYFFEIDLYHFTYFYG